MPFLSHAGVSLRYDRIGAGPAALLIHGWTCNRSFWERQVAALRAHHTVITVDLRGHGESTPPRSGYSLGALAGDLEHLVRALALPGSPSSAGRWAGWWRRSWRFASATA